MGGAWGAWDVSSGLPCQRVPTHALAYPSPACIGVRRVDWAMPGVMLYDLGVSAAAAQGGMPGGCLNPTELNSNPPSWAKLAQYAGTVAARLAEANIPHNVLFAYTPTKGEGYVVCMCVCVCVCV